MSQPFNEALINNMTIDERMHYNLPINYKDVDHLQDEYKYAVAEIDDLQELIDNYECEECKQRDQAFENCMPLGT